MVRRPPLRHRRAARPPGPQHPTGRAARLPLLSRPRGAPPRSPVPRAAARRRGQCPLPQPQPLARLAASPRGGRPGRPAVLRDAGPARAPARDAAVPRFAPSVRRRAGRSRPDRRGPALRPRLRRRHGLRLGAPPPPGRRLADRAAPDGVGPHPAGGAAAVRLRLAEGLGPRARRRLGTSAGRCVRRGLRQRRSPQLVSQPRRHGRGAVPPAERRRHPRRLLGRHGHPARSPEAADVRRAGRRGDRRQLAEVPAGGAGEVPRRPRRRAPAPSLPEAREAAASDSTRCSVRSSSSVG